MLLELLRGNRELLCTFDPQVYADVVSALRQSGIKYRVKSANTGSGSNRQSILGSLGEAPALQIQYQIFVHQKDFDAANHCYKYR